MMQEDKFRKLATARNLFFNTAEMLVHTLYECKFKTLSSGGYL